MAMITQSMQPTSEQLTVADACLGGASLVMEAGAGTGKTSTLRLAATAMTRMHGVYVAYTKITAEEARRTFPADVTCVTAHSLAYSAVGHRYAGRLPGQSRRMQAWAVANHLGIGAPLPLGDRYLLTQASLAKIVMGTIERYCHSADTDISGSHVPPVHGIDPDSFADLTWWVVPHAKQAWLDLADPRGRLPFKHDHYLKMWQLSRPVIRADYIMFDEAQDADPAVAAIIQQQASVQQIIVGDSCQAIYGWRGAEDALATWPADIRLNLTRSFRFGQVVAEEANKWLRILDAGYRLSGSPAIGSVVRAVPDPQVILCRTNAEALLQARTALDAGQRVALAGRADDIRLLALTAIELRETGQTSNAELAGFRSWHDIQAYVRGDAAGADLAAGVRLIDKYGAEDIIATLAQLTSQTRADVTVTTAHGAKGREWERVRIADDFREPQAGTAVARSDAMLAYVAVTRAREQLDRTGLGWVDSYAARASAAATATKKEERKEKAMNQITAGAADPLPDSEAGNPRPYTGGRAQAESASLTIRSDYDAWTAAGGLDTLPGEHPRIQQFGWAWRAVARRGLDDEAGPASVRYQVLSHAANSLAEAIRVEVRQTNTAALSRLAFHALQHGWRLQATAEEKFMRSPQSGPYTDGRAQAAAGSKLVAKDYDLWAQTPAAALAVNDTRLWRYAQRLDQAWHQVRQHGLDDGPGLAAARYSDLGDAAAEMASAYPAGLPSSALAMLLDLRTHAGKHATRLSATADAQASAAGGTREEQQMAAAVEQFQQPPGAYQGLPAGIAAVASSAHSGQPANLRETAGTPEAKGRDARTHQQQSAKEQER
jgi:AAA domain